MYNDWIADFCAEAPGRRAGVGLITLDDIDETVRQVRWLREHDVFGGSAARIPVFRALKERFDPHGVLSPGRMAGRI